MLVARLFHCHHHHLGILQERGLGMVSTGLLRNDVQVILFAQLFINYLLPGYKIGTRTKGNQGKKYLIGLKKSPECTLGKK